MDSREGTLLNELVQDAMKSAFQGSLDRHDRKRTSDVRAQKTDNICSLFMYLVFLLYSNPILSLLKSLSINKLYFVRFF